MRAGEILDRVTSDVRELAKVGLGSVSATDRLLTLERCELLHRLSTTKLAGPDTQVQFEYVSQAIIDAIDALAPSSDDRIEQRHPEYHAARELFGLTAGSRHKSWTSRQRLAAAAYSVSYDHFRSKIQPSLLRVIADQIFSTQPESDHFEIALAAASVPGIHTFANQQVMQTALINIFMTRSRPTPHCWS